MCGPPKKKFSSGLLGWNLPWWDMCVRVEVGPEMEEIADVCEKRAEFFEDCGKGNEKQAVWSRKALSSVPIGFYCSSTAFGYYA